jgi:hypothetical protein
LPPVTDSREKYYTHLILDPIKDLDDAAKKLKESKDERIKKYFEDGETREVKLRTRFLSLSVEDDLLRGTVKFETAEEITDIDDKLVIIPKAHLVKFFIALNPRPHLVVLGDKHLARIFSRIVSRIFFNDDSTRTPRVKLTDGQIIRFLENNRCVLKGAYWSTVMDGVSTIGALGSNIQKPVEAMALISKYLAEHKAIKPLLLDYNWTMWISSKTGVLYCLDSHDPVDFIEFIQQKILPLLRV